MGRQPISLGASRGAGQHNPHKQGLCPQISIENRWINARMFTCTARSLVSTIDSIATSCSVNAYGRCPPKLCLFGVIFCDTKSSASRAFELEREVFWKATRVALHLLAQCGKTYV